MLSIFQDSVLIVITVVCALLIVAGVNLAWPWEKRRTHNDLIGWQLSILGTTYAVILGFMLYTVWTNFGEADLNVDLEANALVNLFELAQGIPEPERSQIKALAKSYADAAIHQDWPRMAAGSEPDATIEINLKMWRTLTSIKSTAPVEITAEDHALSELSSLSEHRRTRVLQNASRLPIVLWCVLLVGGALTIISSCMFGSESIRLHAFQVFAFSLLISFCLAAIADINRPFQGSIHISDLAFRRAQINMGEN
jgi:hypothetical protein